MNEQYCTHGTLVPDGRLFLAFDLFSGHTNQQNLPYEVSPGFGMFEQKSLIPKSENALLVEAPSRAPEDTKQRRLMTTALVLLLVALGFVLFRDRDFWFPAEQEADLDQPETVTATVMTQPAAAIPASAPAAKSKHVSASKATPKTQPAPSDPVTATATATRTVLPPLEVEVVAGDARRIVRPGNNAVRVDLQPGTSPRSASEPITSAGNDTAAAMTSNAAEHVQMSADASEIVSHPVKPGYPMLARQMKVQGSVILQALISKEGAIQDLHVVSGSPILAGAAQTAVRQWRFKPHYQGAEAVETQAKITVNFTISTN